MNNRATLIRREHSFETHANSIAEGACRHGDIEAAVGSVARRLPDPPTHVDIVRQQHNIFKKGFLVPLWNEESIPS